MHFGVNYRCIWSIFKKEGERERDWNFEIACQPAYRVHLVALLFKK